MMKFVGQEYLMHVMKPLIDLIYAERKCCEIDPARLRGISQERLEQNQVCLSFVCTCILPSATIFVL